VNPYRHFRHSVLAVIEALAAEGALPSGLDMSHVSADAPPDRELGDITTNAAMVLAKQAKMAPRELAALLVPRIEALDHVVGAAAAGPGFINFHLDDAFWHGRLAEILTVGPAYGASMLGGGEAVNVEFTSSNPTGPLHVGHARGAVVGDALASLLEKAGYAVTREYYINDSGAQVEVLARSLHRRYAQALGEDGGEPPEGFYPGDYLIPVAEALAERDGNKWLDLPEDEWLEPLRQVAVEAMMDLIREDLDALGVRFQVFSSERALTQNGAVERALDFLESRGLIYEGVLEPPKGKSSADWEPRPQTLFKSTEFGDDVDRPIRKADGSWTYFATDIAYHLDKYRRGFKSMIDVLGVDHGGYVKRLKAAVKALTGGEGSLDVKLCALVNFMDGGRPVKMSKRAGAYVTLADVIEHVGKDVVRFIMLTRKNDQPLDFDFIQVTEKSRDNMVFYVQYAHARVCSVMRHAACMFDPGELTPAALSRVDARRLTDPAELDLIKTMAGWPQVVEAAALAHEPHRVAYYLADLAARFHALWNKGNDDAALRFIVEGDRRQTAARLALIQGLAFVIASGLQVFGVTPVEEMR
jgi:arginyl-tRNA synthetase